MLIHYLRRRKIRDKSWQLDVIRISSSLVYYPLRHIVKQFKASTWQVDLEFLPSLTGPLELTLQRAAIKISIKSAHDHRFHLNGEEQQQGDTKTGKKIERAPKEEWERKLFVLWMENNGIYLSLLIEHLAWNKATRIVSRRTVYL